ncbi:MAG TPA: GYD domain-containing protein [Gammaproteobacteria bacterium]|nr:GYD domain-containing protein [Gammaproteobacteria bacterium]
MPIYIMLVNWTQQSVGNVKESPMGFDAFKQSPEQAGSQLKSFYLVIGQYDMICVVEVPSDEVIAKLGRTNGAKR